MSLHDYIPEDWDGSPKRIIRDHLLSQSDGEKYNELREQIKRDFPPAVKVFEGVVRWDSSDGGQALCCETLEDPNETDYVNGLHVLLNSWDDKREHPQAETLRGKKIRVTVEIIG